MVQDRSLGMSAAEVLALIGWPDDRKGRRNLYRWAHVHNIGKIPGTNQYLSEQIMQVLERPFAGNPLPGGQPPPELSAYERQKRKADGGKTSLPQDGKKARRKN